MRELTAVMHTTTTGGKGTPRHKQKRNVARNANDDKKLQTTLKKLNTQPIQAIEEVNMFKSDGNVIHFSAPKGMWCPPDFPTLPASPQGLPLAAVALRRRRRRRAVLPAASRGTDGLQ